jgi:glutamate decarboxylase
MIGLGSTAVIPIAVDSSGRMLPSALSSAIQTAKTLDQTPFFVNTTAGTTVLGSYDPFLEISKICKQHNLWLHIDASWGGPVIFSQKQKPKMHGSHLADSIAINPHKMLNVPVTCSFLLTNDLSLFHKANTLPAGYLFHSSSDDGDLAVLDADSPASAANEIWDLADLTLQCGRRGDSLKMALSWIYYGSAGFETAIDGAYEVAGYLAGLIEGHEGFELVGEMPLPCLQVCFYWVAMGGRSAGGGVGDGGSELSESSGGRAENGLRKMRTKEENTATTKRIAQSLIHRGFMVDYAPGERGHFFRVVVNTQTRRETVEGLVKAIVEVGGEM